MDNPGIYSNYVPVIETCGMEDARAPAKESCQVHKRFKYCQSRVLIDVSAGAKRTAAHTVDSLLDRVGLGEK